MEGGALHAGSESADSYAICDRGEGFPMQVRASIQPPVAVRSFESPFLPSPLAHLSGAARQDDGGEGCLGVHVQDQPPRMEGSC